MCTLTFLTSLTLVFSSLNTVSGCGGIVYLTEGRSTQISSPNYPYGYAANLRCIWTVQAPAYKRVHIYRNDIDLERNGPSHCYDYLEVRDEGSTGRLIFRMCINSVYTHSRRSTSRWLWLKFVTDGSRSGRGFSVTLTVAPGGLISPVITSSTTPVIVSATPPTEVVARTSTQTSATTPTTCTENRESGCEGRLNCCSNLKCLRDMCFPVDMGGHTGLSSGAIAGIVFGVLFATFIVTSIVYIVVKQKKLMAVSAVPPVDMPSQAQNGPNHANGTTLTVVSGLDARMLQSQHTPPPPYTADMARNQARMTHISPAFSATITIRDSV